MAFTPEELADMAAFDAEIEETFQLTSQEVQVSAKLDRVLSSRYDAEEADRKASWYRKNKKRIAARQHAYYMANKEKILAQGRAWYRANKDYHRRRKAEWYRNNLEAIHQREAEQKKLYAPYGRMVAEARKARGWTQADLGKALGISGGSVCNYEIGYRKLNWERIQAVMPELGPRPEGFPEN